MSIYPWTVLRRMTGVWLEILGALTTSHNPQQVANHRMCSKTKWPFIYVTFLYVMSYDNAGTATK